MSERVEAAREACEKSTDINVLVIIDGITYAIPNKCPKCGYQLYLDDAGPDFVYCQGIPNGHVFYVPDTFKPISSSRINNKEAKKK